jgi:hypothetical protein
MGLLRARLEQERCGSVAVQGVTTTNQCPAARRRAHRHGTKERKRRKGRGKPWFSQRGGGVDVAGLMETVARRGHSRWRSASHSASASLPRRGRPLPSQRLVRLLPNTAGLQQRHVSSDAAYGSFLPASTLLPPLRQHSQEKGKTPRGLWLAQGAQPWVIGARSKQRRGKDRWTGLPLEDFPGAATWPATSGGFPPLASPARLRVNFPS